MRHGMRLSRHQDKLLQTPAFFLVGALCLSADHHFETYSSTYVTIRGRAPGESIRGQLQLPSILAIVLQLSVHSIQPDAGQGLLVF